MYIIIYIYTYIYPYLFILFFLYICCTIATSCGPLTLLLVQYYRETKLVQHVRPTTYKYEDIK